MLFKKTNINYLNFNFNLNIFLLINLIKLRLLFKNSLGIIVAIRKMSKMTNENTEMAMK